MRPLKIVFVGDGWLGSNARSLSEGFRLAGAEVVLIDTASVNRPSRFSVSWSAAKLAGGRRARWVTREVEKRVQAAVEDFRPDLLFCFKTIHLDQNFLLSLPVMWKFHYSADDVSNAYNTTPSYLEHEHRWDAIITTKRHNLVELEERGVSNPWFVLSAFDPAWHHLVSRRVASQFSVGFIGNYRRDRGEFLVDVASRFGKETLISGPGWSRLRELRQTSAVIEPARYGEDFSISVSATRSQLVLLNSDNRDTHTCRSFEVPAAGGLVIGQRTEEHKQLLDDGTEALLFDSEDEALDLIDRVRREPDWAAVVANNGYRKITEGHHTYLDRALEILARLELRR